MFQKEVGEKIAANILQNYGRLSILTNFRLSVIKKFTSIPLIVFTQTKSDFYGYLF